MTIRDSLLRRLAVPHVTSTPERLVDSAWLGSEAETWMEMELVIAETVEPRHEVPGGPIPELIGALSGLLFGSGRTKET